jgi:hypothetical protein
VQLKHLHELWLYIGRDQLPPESAAWILDPHPLAALRVLYIEIFQITPAQFFFFLPRCFPRVEQLTIKGNDCLQTPPGGEEEENTREEFDRRLRREFPALQLCNLK